VIKGLVSADRLEAAKPFKPVIRDRLNERFALAVAHEITLVAAPAGFGKSVAMRHFLEHFEPEHIRFPLGKQHATVLGFVRGFVDAIESIAPRSAKSVTGVYERAQRSDRPNAELASWLAVLIKKYKGVIAIDDLHVAAPEVTELLIELIDRAGPSLRWIVATRDALDLPVASWLAYGRMEMPIDEVDLRLSFDEAAHAARQCGVRIHESELKTLWTLTDGWPTAFTFALRTSTRTQDLRRVAAGTREMIFAYLAEQIFNGLSEDDRDFLLESSVLSEIDLDVFLAAGRSDVEARVARLQKRTAFIVSESERRYKYHDLFREFLEHQLRTRGKLAHERAMASAASLLSDAGKISDALPLFCQVTDETSIARILESHGSALVSRGHVETVEHALSLLGAARRGSSASLLALAADLKAFRGAHAEASGLFRLALEKEIAYDLRAEIVNRFATILTNEFKHLEASALLESLESQLITDQRTKARFLALLATVWSSLGKPASKHLLDEAVGITSQLDDPVLKAEVLHQAGHASGRLGQFDDAQKLAASAVRAAEEQGLFGLAARATSVLANIAHSNGDPKRNQWALAQVMRYAERGGDRFAWFYGLANSYDLAVERNDSEKIAELDAKLEATSGSDAYRSAVESLLPAFALQFAWNSDFASAERVLAGTAETMGTLAHATLRHAEIALYAAASNDRETAENSIKSCQEGLLRLEDSPESITPRVVRSRLWFAMASLILGRPALANNALREVEREGRRITPAMRALGVLVRATFVHVETGSGHSEMAAALEGVREAGLGGYARVIEQLPLPTVSSSPRFASLTKTEVKVLCSLAVGGSSKSIGSELGRSSQTIDSHVKAIIRKLGCRGRQEAVSLAREHGIV
jgi:LuxR family maltose regulon positive regulatory protein